MSNRPTVSVILPTHNRANMLRRAVASVLSQTYPDFELIIVSDGSRDDTAAVVDSYRDDRIVFLEHEISKGASAARNTGIRASVGGYIAFLDDDDEWLPEKLAKQIRLIESSKSEVGLIYSWMQYYKGHSKVKVHSPDLKGDVFLEMLDRQAIGGCPTIIVKRNVIDIIGGFDEELPRGNDGDFIRRVTEHFHVEFIPEILVNVYIGHSDRISINSIENMRSELVAMEKRLTNFQDAFDRYPQKKANVLAQMAATALKTRQYATSIHYVREIIHCPVYWTYKVRVMVIATKNTVLFYLRRIVK